MPYEIVIWEKLFWFLKFLIPKLVVKDPKAVVLLGCDAAEKKTAGKTK